MFKIIVLFVSVFSSIVCENSEPKLFTNPLKVDSDVLNVQKSLDQVKSLLNQLDANQFTDLNELVDKIQTDLKLAKRQFDIDNDFEKLAQRVGDFKDELNRFAPKFQNDLEKFWRKR